MKTQLRNWTLLLVVTLLAVACSTEKKQYVNVIPADASLVASFNMRQMIEKCALSEADTKQLQDEIGKAIKNEMAGNDVDLINKIMANPSESGIDWRENLYVFALPGGNITGIVVAVSDKSKLEEAMNVLVSQNACKPFKDGAGFSYTTVEEQSLIAYNETTLLVLLSQVSGEVETLESKADEWLNASENTYAETESFKKLVEIGGDIALIASTDILSQQYLSMVKMSLPEQIDLKNIKSAVAVRFEQGKMIMDAENFYTDKTVESMVKEQMKIYAGKVDDTFMEKYPNDAMLWMGINLNGKELYTYLLNNNVLGEKLKSGSLPIDVEKMVSAIDGQVALGIGSDASIPSIGLYAEVNNDDFLQDLSQWKPILDLQKISYGVEDGVFYLTNQKEVSVGNSLKKAPWAREADGKLFFMMIDFRSWGGLLASQTRGVEGAVIKMLSEYIDYVTVSADDATHSSLTFIMRDKEKNVLEQWVNAVKKMNGMNE